MTNEQLAERIAKVLADACTLAERIYPEAWPEQRARVVDFILRELAAAGEGAEVTRHFEVEMTTGDDFWEARDDQCFPSADDAESSFESNPNRGTEYRVVEVVRRAVGRGEGSNQP